MLIATTGFIHQLCWMESVLLGRSVDGARNDTHMIILSKQLRHETWHQNNMTTVAEATMAQSFSTTMKKRY